MFHILLGLLAGTLVISAVLTPGVYSLLQQLLGAAVFAPPFSRVFDRVAMVVLAGLVVAYRKDFALPNLAAWFRSIRLRLKAARVLIGLTITFAAVVGAQISIVFSGELAWAGAEPAVLARKMALALPAALLISVLEETFFRVLLFQRLQELFRPFAAALIASLIYSFVHFIAPVKTFAYTGFAPAAGFQYLLEVGARLFAPGLQWPFLGLVLVGLVLCSVIYTTKSLFLCIGLHSGWVLGLKFAKHASVIAPGVSVPPGAGTRYFLIGQPAAWVSILAVFALMYAAIQLFGFFSQDERAHRVEPHGEESS